jgi:hypothetical protein
MRMKTQLLAFIWAAAFALAGAAQPSAAQSGQKVRQLPATPVPTATPPAPKKATARPAETEGRTDSTPHRGAAEAGATAPQTDPNAPRFAYHFSQPDFFVHTIQIEHDETGRGQIRFERRSDIEQITEPFQLSPTALARINAHWSALDYLGSAESYQAPRDHSNLGRTRLFVRRGA